MSSANFLYDHFPVQCVLTEMMQLNRKVLSSSAKTLESDLQHHSEMASYRFVDHEIDATKTKQHYQYLLRERVS